MKQRSLDYKVAVVTGGARGIGKAIASALAEAGMTVAVCDVDVSGVTHAALAEKVDVTDVEALARFFDRVESRLGPIDVLVNNAGIMPTGLVDEMRPQVNERVVQINLVGVINGISEAARRMKPRGRGHIVNISSLTARLPGAGVATYCASKAGVLVYCQAAAVELAGTGVELSVIIPSMVKTELVDGITVRRGTPTCVPADVANRVVDVLRRPRFETYVPRTVAPLAFVHQMLPARIRLAVARLTRADRLITELDRGARTNYERRVRQLTGQLTRDDT
jgi:NAD(P)-dependent dehydrogenase (short-subunit alcohol dehydrogenase family)